MDFHGLARRQLQALCKANKIPANMTNLAMADALSALDNVEGIEEVMQPQTPEKVVSGSPEVPRTVTRTSTRARKPPVKVLESGGVVSHSTARTSRRLVDEDEKKDMAKTPAVAGSRKRAPAAASCKKAEVPSVQKVYSTRRSVRLVEKQLSELCLGESKARTQPIKIDNELLCEMTECDVKGDNLAEVSSETSPIKAIDDEVDSRGVYAQVVETISTACAVKENEVASNVAAASEIVEVVVVPEPEKFLMSQIASDEVSDLGVKEEIATELAGELGKDISIDGEFDSVAMVEEASFETSTAHDKVVKNVKGMKMETQANKLDSVAPAATENGYSTYPEPKAELRADECFEAPVSEFHQQFVSNKSNFEDSTEDVNCQEQLENVKSCEDPEEVTDRSEPRLVTVEKKLGAQSPALEQITDLVEDSPPATENIGKENTVECFKVPKKPLEHMSMGELRKLLKVMTISNTGNKAKEGDANKHQDIPRPTRQALETLPRNTQV